MKMVFASSCWDSFFIGVVFGINLVTLIRLCKKDKGRKK